MKAMKCQTKGCDGGYRVLSSYYSRGIKKRHRKCSKCGHEDYTIEISSTEYERMRSLIVGLKVLLKDYLGQ
jgi:hypothetical protein